MSICIVIPVYQDSLNEFEKISLKQTVKMLEEFDIYFCEPNKINTDIIREEYKNIKVEKFDDSFFKGILGYNKLMLSDVFYNRFKEYDYMLLCQLDAYIFKNNLKKWCDKDYDYIGSPWLAGKNNFIKKAKTKLKPKHKKKREEIFFKVGNGGLSLRKIATFNKIIKEHPIAITEQLKIPKEDYRLMEDVFWSIEAPKLTTNYKIPNYKKAVHFAIDRRPKVGFKLTENKLPFGCHGFNKKNVLKFWETKIPELNTKLNQ